MDALLLQILKHKTQYERLIPEIERSILNKNTLEILDGFGEWFRTCDDECIDIEDFKSVFFTFNRHKDNPDKQRYYNKMLDNCKSDATPEQIMLISEKIITHTLATQMANLAERFHAGDEIDLVDEVGIKHSRALEQIDQDTGVLHIDTKIGVMLEDEEHATGIQFGLPLLRDNIRPLQCGDFIVIAGRPDTGKTSFISSQLSYFINTMPTKRDVLWFNNEGQGNRIIKRIYQSVLQATTQDLLEANRAGTLDARYELAVGSADRIKVIDCHNWTSYQVEKAIKHYEPGLVIFDMIDNIRFPNVRSDARSDQILEQMYQWARVLGVKYDFPVLATSQISAEAEQGTIDTACFPEMHMLKDSKTGKQGAADTIIMIGRNNTDTSLKNKRYISTPKNKLAKTDSYIKGMVDFDPQRAMYL